MKAFCVLISLIFLASCGSEVITEEVNSPDISAVEQTVDNIEEVIDVLPEEDIELTSDENTTLDDVPEEDTAVAPETDSSELPELDTIAEPEPEESSRDQAWVSPKVVELSTTYQNPKMEVIMDIEYAVAEDGTISEISVTSPNYQGMPEFNTWVQAVVWMTVAEASDYVVSGSSLTTPAYQAAMKNS